ncbi:MAG: hypothetical protein IJX75_00285 [Clostridia bacterium]|nr:hypothetical protein [Clostridia bacterium]
MKHLRKRFVALLISLTMILCTFTGCAIELRNFLFGDPTIARNDDITISSEFDDNYYVYTVIPHCDIEHLEITVSVKTLDGQTRAEWEFYIAPLAEAGETYTFSLSADRLSKLYEEGNIEKTRYWSVTAGKIVG